MIPVRVGARGAHPALASFGVYSALSALTIAAIAVFGDPRAGSPVFVQPLFKEAPAHGVGLKTQLGPDGEILDPGPIPEGAEVLDLSDGGYGALADPQYGAPEMGPARTPRSSLPKAPIAGMSQPGPNGPMPIIAADGRTPMQVYSRPFSNPSARPMVALVVGGLGLNAKTTTQAIETLPPEVTLSFVPYSKDLQAWINHARAYGHEVMLELPMEPFDYPDNDTGPQTLLASAKGDENAKKLSWLLSRAAGYFGVVNYQGAKFASSAESTRQTMNAVRGRGLAFLHDGSAAKNAFADAARASGAAFAGADRVIDSDPNPADIDQQLLMLEALALQNGAALGAGFGYPVTIDQAAGWAEGLAAKGYALAPASAIVRARSSK